MHCEHSPQWLAPAIERKVLLQETALGASVLPFAATNSEMTSALVFQMNGVSIRKSSEAVALKRFCSTEIVLGCVVRVARALSRSCLFGKLKEVIPFSKIVISFPPAVAAIAVAMAEYRNILVR